jgi:hypothetical protein
MTIQDAIRLIDKTKSVLTIQDNEIRIILHNGPSRTFTDFDTAINFITISHRPQLAVDTKLLVWDDGEGYDKTKRYFSHWDHDGKPVVFKYGGTSWNTPLDYTCAYDNWEYVD